MTRWRLAAALLLTGCQASVAPVIPPVASVLISPDTATVIARATLQLQAVLLDSSGHPLSGRAVHWTSSDPFLATVSSTGLVTGVGHGSVIVTATAEQRSGTAHLTVFAPVASVTVDQGDQTIVVGGAVQLSATPHDWRGVALAARVVSWSSSDAGTVAVTPAGVATGHAPGTGVLTATSEGQAGSATITVALLELRELAPGLSTHTCGLTRAGATFCWGSDAYGQLGNGPGGDNATAVLTKGDHTFATVSGGGRFTCGVVTGGAAYCWGSGSRGRLGNGSVAGSPIPVAVAGGLDFRTLSAGFSHACALTDDGAAYCWGDNGTWQLGTVTLKLGLTPSHVVAHVSFSTIAVGDGFTCALAAQGDLLLGEQPGRSTRQPRGVDERGAPPRSGYAGVHRARVRRAPQLRRDSGRRCVLLGRQSLGRAGRWLDAPHADARPRRGRTDVQHDQHGARLHLRCDDRRRRVLLGG